MRNRALNRQRDRRPTVPWHATAMQAAENQVSPGFELPEIVPLEDRLNVWLAELPERRREAFHLSRFEAMRYVDIAEVMGISVRTVEHHIGEALRFLRDKLSAYK